MSRAALSPYYPPRARWYRVLWFRRLQRARPVVDYQKVQTTGRIICSFLVPGLGFYVRSPGLVSKLILVTCFLLGVLSLVELGRIGGNICFGLLLSVHASGLSLLLETRLPGLPLRGRIFLTLGLLLALGGLLYSPARTLIQNHLFAPVQIHDQVVVLEKFRTPPQLRRGDWIAYSLTESGDHNAYVRAGLGLSKILAVGGDQVRFSKTTFEVNGVPGKRFAWMPESGELTVPEKHWFIWPEMSISGHGLLAEGTIASTLLQMATIPESQFEGKPFKRWFWHRQHAP